MADKYLLQVTAGPSYDPSTHQTVQVNTATSTRISSPLCDASIAVRIQNYRGMYFYINISLTLLSSIPGLPRKSPTTSPYFSHAPHTSDQYSISFTFVPKKTIPGSSLIFGNDFDHPVRDQIPPGFGAAFKFVKYWIDPGLDGDVYSDKPYLYGNALSSVNVLYVGDTVNEGNGELDLGENGEKALEEGGEGEGTEWRKGRQIPDTADARKKHFLVKGKTAEWEWESNRVYKADFFNPYLDFNEFALKLPHFSISLLPYLGGADYLRYVLKDKDTGEVFFVVVFTLLKKEDVEKGEVEQTPAQDASDGDHSDRREDKGQKFEPESNDLD